MWPLYVTRRNEHQGRYMLDIRTVLNGGRAKHCNRLLETVESLLQKRLKYGQNNHIAKEFQRLVNLFSVMLLTRGSPEAPPDPPFLHFNIFRGKGCHPSHQTTALQNSRAVQHLPRKQEEGTKSHQTLFAAM